MKPVNENMQKKSNMGAKLMKLFFLIVIIFILYFVFIKISEKKQLNTQIDHVSQDIVKNYELDNHEIVKNKTNIIIKECVDTNYVDLLLLISNTNFSLKNNVEIVQMIEKLNSMNLYDSKLKELVAQLNSYNFLKIDNYYMLNQEFQNLYDQLIMSIALDETSSNWFYKYFHRIISVRKIGQRAIEGGGIDGLLAQAKVAMDNNNLQHALYLINSMPETQKNIASSWLVKLNNFVQIQDIVSKMYDLVIAPQYRSKFSMVCRDD
jgi:hypothetical protein